MTTGGAGVRETNGAPRATGLPYTTTHKGKKKKSLAGIPSVSEFREPEGYAPSVGKKKKSLTESIFCQGLPKNGGDLLSQLVGQYHRRG